MKHVLISLLILSMAGWVLATSPAQASIEASEAITYVPTDPPKAQAQQSTQTETAQKATSETGTKATNKSCDPSNCSVLDCIKQGCKPANCKPSSCTGKKAKGSGI